MSQAKSNFNIEELFGKPVEEVDEILSSKEKHIMRIQIPKKDGTMRNVLAPDKHLKYIQRSLYWKFFRRFKPSEAAHGFVSKHGIVTNAREHLKPKSMGKIDVKKFFDSISVDHLKNCLFGNKNICRYCKHYERMMDGGCHPSIYKNKAQKFDYRCEEIKAVYIPHYCQETGYKSLFLRIIDACTYNNYTAQGFPTSPVIANIVMRGFDKTMLEFCAQNHVSYTRYADDLTFSSKRLDKKQLRNLIQKKVYRLLWAYGFSPNYDKTMWRDRARRMKTCGVVINEKLSVQRSQVLLFRAKVHNATVKNAENTSLAMIRKLKGYASFIMCVDKVKGEKYMKMLDDFEKSKFKKE